MFDGRLGRSYRYILYSSTEARPACLLHYGCTFEEIRILASVQFIERVSKLHVANTHDNDNYKNQTFGQSVEYGNRFVSTKWGYYPIFVPVSMPSKKIWRQPVRGTDHLVPGLVGTLSTDMYLPVEAPNFQRRYYVFARLRTPAGILLGLRLDWWFYVSSRSYRRNRRTVGSVVITAASRQHYYKYTTTTTTSTYVFASSHTHTRAYNYLNIESK